MEEKRDGIIPAGAMGKKGEAFAAAVLQEKGYQILSRNYHSRFGEVDIIASDGDVICFVEVKTRRKGSLVGGLEAVTPVKQRKLIATALHYMQQHSTQLQPRFDVFVVNAADGMVCGYDYLTGAFDADGF